MAEGHSSLTPRTQRVAYALAAALTLVAITIGTVRLIYRKDIEPGLERIEAAQERHFETYLDDIEFLERSEIARILVELGSRDSAPIRARETASTAQDSADVGAILNPLLFWRSEIAFGRNEPLVLPASREFIMRYQDDWMRGRNFLERGRIKADLSIFEKIGGMKSWDIEAHSPIEEYLKKARFVAPADLPVPDSLDILTAVKVRLIQGSIDKNPLAALKAVRQLASLLLTTENHQMLMTGLAAFDLERRAYREYVDNELIDRAAWSPIDTNTTHRAGRAFNATAGYLRASTSEKLFSKIFFSEIKPPGLCAAGNLQFPTEFAYRSQLSGGWPFETSFHSGFKRLDRTFESGRGSCRWRRLRALESASGFDGPAPEAPWIIRSLPYFRTLFALRDWISWPLRFDGYERR